MSQGEWAAQLRKIEREFDGLPPEPSPAALRAMSEAERRAHDRAAARSSAIGATARLILVLALAVGINYWPYSRDCGSGLYAYLAAEIMIVAGGLWIAAYAWRHRMPRTHILAGLIILGGLVLVAAELLPRVGYAAVDPGHAPQWSCLRPESLPRV